MLLSQSDIKYEIDTTSYPEENITQCTMSPENALELMVPMEN